jgi:integrase
MQQVELFLKSCRSQQTRKNYEVSFQKYIDFVGGDNNLFCDNNPRQIEEKIIEFILSLREKGKSYSAISNYLHPIKAFYKINDIVLNVYKISKFMPEQIKVNRDRAYTHEEIGKMLEVADERMKVVVLLLASTGMRIGAIPDLRIRNLQENKITVYESTNEEYFTFTTPECKKAIDFYLDFRSRYGEKINDDSVLIREQFDIRDPFAIKNPKQVIHKTIQWNLRVLAIKCGIRKNADRNTRQQVMMSHGFRKFFTTQLVNSKINPEIREMLLGHEIGLASAYYKPTEQEMYDEYQKAVNNLTINEENRLKTKVEKLEKEKDKFDMFAMKVADNFRNIEEKLTKLKAEGNNLNNDEFGFALDEFGITPSFGLDKKTGKVILDEQSQ